MVVIVVALDDCTMSVTNAPQNAPDNGVAAALLSVARSPEPATALRPPVMTLMPSKNRPTPPRTEIVVDIHATSGAAISMLDRGSVAASSRRARQETDAMANSYDADSEVSYDQPARSHV